jgi:uncharacterized protein
VAEDERSLPLFPLNTVLFPGMPLPLRIFEERYKLMIGTCLVTDRTFGVCLIREGQEVGGPALPFEVGTTASIVDVQRRPNGEMNLMTVGGDRFRLLRVVSAEPYLVGRVQPLPSPPDLADVGLARDVADRFRAYARDLRGGEDAALPLADEPEALSFQLAAILNTAAGTRQDLLELQSTDERLRRLRRIIRREHDTLRVMARAGPGKSVGPFSLN